MHSTTIIRTHNDIDSIDGVSWCIPEGRYISVGISMELTDAEKYEKETVLKLLEKAYQRRGIDYLRHFPESREIVVVPKTLHFIHKKICGKNWLMAGGSASQIWYPSGSNISLTLFAAKIAPKVLMSNPKEWLDIYQSINKNLISLHSNWSKWINDECKTLAEAGSFAKEIYSIGNKRMALYALVRNGEKYAQIAKEMSMTDIPKYALMSQEIRVVKEPELSRQTLAIDKAKDAMYDYIDRSVKKNNVNHKITPVELKAKISNEIVDIVSELIGLDKQVDFLDREIPELGFSSVTLTKFAENILQKYSINIHPGVFFEYTTLNAFIGHLLEEHIEAIRNYFANVSSKVNLLADARPATMNKKIPIIIGAGITGMCISRSLSQAQIPHIMIGNLMVDDTPKLGESMNESASIDFLQDYSEFKQHYFVKNELNFYSGETAALLNFKGRNGHTFYDAYNRLGFNPGTSYAHLIHLERLGFDRQLYEQVSMSSYCQVIKDVQVKSLDYSDDGENIGKVYLSDGQTFTPSFVFDATNNARLIGRLLNIEVEIFDKPRTIFFTHYCAKHEQNSKISEKEHWKHATNIVRANQQIDGIDGICWCIPEGDYVSVGISVDAEQAKSFTTELALKLVARAYSRRGINFIDCFSKNRQLMKIENTRHFMHKKVHGQNWLMAGGSASQIWFPSASNISLSLFAAKIAPMVFDHNPVQWLDVYKQINNNLAKLHQSYNTWVYGDGKSLATVGVFARTIYSFGNKRMGLYALVRNGEQYADIARKISTSEISQYALMNREIRVLKEQDLSMQTERIDKAREILWRDIERTTINQDSMGSDKYNQYESTVEVS